MPCSFSERTDEGVGGADSSLRSMAGRASPRSFGLPPVQELHMRRTRVLARRRSDRRALGESRARTRRRSGEDPRPARCRVGGPRRRRRAAHQGGQRPRPVLPAGLAARRRPVVPDGRDPAAGVGHARRAAWAAARCRATSRCGRSACAAPRSAPCPCCRRKTQDDLRAYADGVNAWIARNELPGQYATRAGDEGRAVERGGQRAGPQAGRVRPVLRPRHRPDDGRAGLRRGRARRSHGGVRRSLPVRAVQPGLAGDRRHAAAERARHADRRRRPPASRACRTPSPGWRPTT